jgi:hypothetical protein
MNDNKLGHIVTDEHEIIIKVTEIAERTSTTKAHTRTKLTIKEGVPS